MTATLTEQVFTEVTIKKSIKLEAVKNLLCTAFEGDVGYWCRINGYVYPQGTTKVDYQPGGRLGDGEPFYPHLTVPTLDGGKIKLCVDGVDKSIQNEWEPSDPKQRKHDADSNESGYVHYLYLTPEKIKKGLEVMAAKCPIHFNDFTSENDDATTGDVFLQCCLFPEIVEKTGIIFG